MLSQTHSVFKDGAVNAYIHNFEVMVWEGRHCHPFQISCKSSRHGLRFNRASFRTLGERWQGDLVVMRISKKDPLRPTDMQGKDAARVAYAVKK